MGYTQMRFDMHARITTQVQCIGPPCMLSCDQKRNGWKCITLVWWPDPLDLGSTSHVQKLFTNKPKSKYCIHLIFKRPSLLRTTATPTRCSSWVVRGEWDAGTVCPIDQHYRSVQVRTLNANNYYDMVYTGVVIIRMIITDFLHITVMIFTYSWLLRLISQYYCNDLYPPVTLRHWLPNITVMIFTHRWLWDTDFPILL